MPHAKQPSMKPRRSIKALPTVKAAGGGVIYLYHQPGKTWHGMDAQKALSLRSLLILVAEGFPVPSGS